MIWGIQHIGLGNTYGRINDFTGKIVYDANNLAESSVSIVAQVGTIDSNDEKRDNHLRAADIFDVATHPELSFVGTGFVKGEEEGHYLVTGTFTMRGVSKEITVPFHKVGEGTHFFTKKPAIGFEGEFFVNPKEFGVGQGQVASAIGDKARIIVALEGLVQ